MTPLWIIGIAASVVESIPAFILMPRCLFLYPNREGFSPTVLIFNGSCVLECANANHVEAKRLIEYRSLKMSAPNIIPAVEHSDACDLPPIRGDPKVEVESRPLPNCQSSTFHSSSLLGSFLGKHHSIYAVCRIVLLPEKDTKWAETSHGHRCR